MNDKYINFDYYSTAAIAIASDVAGWPAIATYQESALIAGTPRPYKVWTRTTGQ